MASRTERVEARIAPDEHSRIKRAADLEHTSISSFMVAAAAEKADRVIAEYHTTTVPAGFYDDLLAALDTPGVLTAALADAEATRASVVTRR